MRGRSVKFFFFGKWLCSVFRTPHLGACRFSSALKSKFCSAHFSKLAIRVAQSAQHAELFRVEHLVALETFRVDTSLSGKTLSQLTTAKTYATRSSKKVVWIATPRFKFDVVMRD